MFPGCVRSGISPEGFNGGLLLPPRGLSYFWAANLPLPAWPMRRITKGPHFQLPRKGCSLSTLSRTRSPGLQKIMHLGYVVM